ncbi:SIR2 family protein [Leptolyngbya boryana CZ1]|uniref:SIR2 family protein n=1 Tax=Leptolyngbya boryana CZ1 TaxID=3060204 RepID=A0AA96WYN0_LEPBY|nr:SIR2 family protein [Leptolyngbya boryana]WNZ47892.1 SIR2 family protein [Leptolyngbya boryana CZ1]
MKEHCIDFAIVTALELERMAVCHAFGMSDRHRVRKESRTYWQKQLKLKDGEFYEIVVTQLANMATADAVSSTADLIRHWSPGAIVLVGIAAGIDPKEQNLGDLVISSSIYYYERSKVTPQGQQLEPYMIDTDATLWNRVQNLAAWKASIPEPRPDQAKTRPKIHRGVIASGEKVIADAIARNKLVEEHRKIIAIEMEGYGLSKAVQQNFQHIRHLVIKAICDWADESKDKEWQPYAAAVAAAFTKHFLLDRPIDPGNPRSTIVKTRAKNESFDDRFAEIISAFSTGSIVPFLGSGINLYNRTPMSSDQLAQLCDRILHEGLSIAQSELGDIPLSEIELAPLLGEELKRLLRLNRDNPEQDLLRSLLGVPCLFCHVDPMNRPAHCPLQGDHATWDCPLAIEQRLAIAKMNLRFISQYFKLTRSSDALYGAIRRFSRQAKPNAIHHFFATLPQQFAQSSGELPYQLIATTNYDTLLEDAFLLAGQPFDVVFYDSEGDDRGKFKHRRYRQQVSEVIEHREYREELPLGEYPIILKLYGSIDEDFVITEDHHLHYLSTGSFDQKIPNRLLKILKNSSILFMGYSPNDYDLQLLHPIWEQGHLQGHSWFIHQSEPGNIDQKLWEKRNITPIESDLQTCLTELQKGIARETKKYAQHH